MTFPSNVSGLYCPGCSFSDFPQPHICGINVTTGTVVGYTITSNGTVVSMSSNDPWYRLFRALADLFIAGEIDVDELSDGIRHDHPEQYACPAARHVLGSIYLAIDEPDCLCDPYRETPCGCEPMDRRERLRELIGA